MPEPTQSGFFFADLEQASLRLAGAVILYDKEPYYVQDIREQEGIPEARMYKLPVNLNDPPAKFVKKLLNDKAFGKFQPINPGMVNFFEGCPFTGRVSYHASYLDRVPVRRTKQGLSRENTQILNPKDSIDFRGLISSESFGFMVQNKYPDYSDAISSLVADSSIAVTNKYSVGISAKSVPTIMKMTKAVGLFRGNNELLLYPKYSYLREELLEESNLPNNINIF